MEPPPPPATILPTFAYDDTGNPVLRMPDGHVLPVNDESHDRAPLVRDASINGGRPTSAFDLIYEAATGTKLKGKHAVPLKDEFGHRCYAPFSFDPTVCELLTPAALHREYQETTGRKLKGDVASAARVKRAYYKDGISLRNMARQPEYGDLGAESLSAIVRGEKFWYA